MYINAVYLYVYILLNRGACTLTLVFFQQGVICLMDLPGSGHVSSARCPHNSRESHDLSFPHKKKKKKKRHKK